MVPVVLVVFLVHVVLAVHVVVADVADVVAVVVVDLFWENKPYFGQENMKELPIFREVCLRMVWIAAV